MSDDESDFDPSDGGPDDGPQDYFWSSPPDTDAQDRNSAPAQGSSGPGALNTLGMGLLGAVGGAVGGALAGQGNQPGQGKQPNDPYGYTVPEHGYKPGQGYGPGFGAPDQYSQAGSDRSTQSGRRPDRYGYPGGFPFGYPHHGYPYHDTRSMGAPPEQDGWRQKLALVAKIAVVVCFAAFCCLTAGK